MTVGRRVAVATGAAAATTLLISARDRVPPRIHRALIRRNYRGQRVSLIAGPVVAAVSALSAGVGTRDAKVRRAAVLVGLAGGLLGLYDDMAGGAAGGHADRGLAGHLRALRDRRVSTGLVKLLGLGAAGVLAAPSLAGNPVDRAVTAGVIAGSANLVNLLDLRPGRALKAVVLLSVPTLASRAGGDLIAGPVGAASAALPPDLAEQVMLGDAGANALGAVVGLALAAATGPAGRAALLATLGALTLASERVSFTAVIEGVPILRELDAAGRSRPSRE